MHHFNHWNLLQATKESIRQTNTVSARSRGRLRRRVSQLETELRFSNLVARTTISFLMEKLEISEDAFARRMIEIDESERDQDLGSKADELAQSTGFVDMPTQPSSNPVAPRKLRKKRRR